VPPQSGSMLLTLPLILVIAGLLSTSTALSGCSSRNKCAEGYGDCDRDSHCQDYLKCGQQNCRDFEPIRKQYYTSKWDCCYNPNKRNGDNCKGHYGLNLDGGNRILAKLECAPGTGDGTDGSCKTTFTKEECKNACQNTDKRIATCTGWQWVQLVYKKIVGLDLALRLVQSTLLRLGQCILVNGQFGYSGQKSVNRNNVYFYTDNKNYSFTDNIWSGPVYCDAEKKNIIRKTPGDAGWQLVKTCRNTRERGDLKCDYTKVVGISKTKSTQIGTTNTESLDVSAEFSATFGLESGDPLGVVKQKFEASMTIGTKSGFSWTKSSSSTSAFTKREETRTGASFDVNPGQTVSVCQPVGSIREFTIYVDDMCLVDGTSCAEC